VRSTALRRQARAGLAIAGLIVLGPTALAPTSEAVLSALAPHRPPGVRFRAQVVLSFADQEPLPLVCVGNVSRSGQWRMDVDWRMATERSADIFNYREHMLWIWQGETVAMLTSHVAVAPLVLSPASEPAGKRTRLERTIGSAQVADLSPYLRGERILADAASWRTSVEGIHEGPHRGQFAVTQTPPEPIKVREPHLVAMQRHYVSADLRLLESESYDPQGEVVATTRYSDVATLASGAGVPLRSRTDMRPGYLEAKTTVTKTINDEPAGTEVVWEKLPWACCRIDREMQIVDGQYVLPKRTTTYDQEGRVLDDIEYLSVEVCEIPDSIFLLPTEGPGP